MARGAVRGSGSPSGPLDLRLGWNRLAAPSGAQPCGPPICPRLYASSRWRYSGRSFVLRPRLGARRSRQLGAPDVSAARAKRSDGHGGRRGPGQPALQAAGRQDGRDPLPDRGRWEVRQPSLPGALVRLRCDRVLYGAPGPYSGIGRPRVHGEWRLIGSATSPPIPSGWPINRRPIKRQTTRDWRRYGTGLSGAGRLNRASAFASSICTGRSPGSRPRSGATAGRCW